MNPMVKYDLLNAIQFTDLIAKGIWYEELLKIKDIFEFLKDTAIDSKDKIAIVDRIIADGFQTKSEKLFEARQKIPSIIFFS